MHNATDTIPFGLRKVRMMRDIRCPDAVENYYFPLIKYHTRWKTLKRADFTGEATSGPPECMGFAIHGATAEKPVKLSTGEGISPLPLGEFYLDVFERIVRLLEKHGVEPIFLISPRASCVNGRYVTFLRMLDERKIGYVDLNRNYAQAGIDPKTDFRDLDHLNVVGAEKATRYIGKFLMDHYDFATNHSDAVRARWDADCKRYDEAKAAAFAVKDANKKK